MDRNRLHVLLIDDDEDDVIIIRGMLSEILLTSFSVKWVSRYEEGLRSVLSGEFDACLLDYRLGARSGLDLLEEAIRAGCETPIIFLTGQGDHEVDVHAMKSGASDYLVKGQISPDLLERSIRFGIERKRTERELRKARDELELRVQQLSRSNEALRLEEARLEALLELNRFGDTSLKEMIDFVLDRQIALTRSEFGFFGLIDQEETFHMHTWSKDAMAQCAAPERAVHYPVEKAGIWAEAVRKKAPLIMNRYSEPDHRKKGVPEGHVPIQRLMAVPVLDGDSRVEAVSVVANKGEDYDNSDLRQMVLLMDATWNLVQRQRSEKALREAETLAAMGRALSAVAHDIKTPLVAVGGFTRQVQKRLPEGSPEREKLEIVLKETGRLQSMLKDLLFFSRPLQLESGPGDIELVLQESVSIVRPLARRKKVSILMRCVRSGSPVHLDFSRFKQAVINLLTNAVEASPEGEEVVVFCRQKGPEFVLDIVDRGRGIPPEIRAELFLPFFTTKKSGTGLGLPITKKIVESHGGRVEALNKSPRGAVFRIRLPVG
jgi:signal transduction histidine kinase/DNA-binding response OmpR family regulator